MGKTAVFPSTVVQRAFDIRLVDLAGPGIARY